MTPVRNPAIPGTPRDRTGTAGILRKAVAEINSRFRLLQSDVLAIFARIPVYAANDVGDITLYGLTPEQMQAISSELMAAVERWIASGRDPAHSLWWSTYDQQAMQLGAAQSAANLSNLSASYAASRSLEQIIYSTPYKTRLGMAQIRSSEYWTGLATAQKTELAQIIGRAVVDGKNPKAVRTEIMGRIGVGRARAAQYAQTDITNTLRESRQAEADYAETELGIKLGLLWTSALLPTTRHWHASRNGKVYTTAQVKEFYSVNGNRFRCHCAQTECLLDAAGNPILTKKLKATMANELAAWKKANSD
ncbi:hypothetical protein LJR039_004355 [Pseudorhodoferax sp. LjRoot39]|uniref:phage minor head protein n=1 Tax=Pseudorhodoferax sp. LjRoot39 TaxID=3342328 RepID=UPI003ECEC5EC